MQRKISLVYKRFVVAFFMMLTLAMLIVFFTLYNFHQEFVQLKDQTNYTPLTHSLKYLPKVAKPLDRTTNGEVKQAEDEYEESETIENINYNHVADGIYNYISSTMSDVTEDGYNEVIKDPSSRYSLYNHLKESMNDVPSWSEFSKIVLRGGEDEGADWFQQEGAYDENGIRYVDKEGNPTIHKDPYRLLPDGETIKKKQDPQWDRLNKIDPQLAEDYWAKTNIFKSNNSDYFTSKVLKERRKFLKEEKGRTSDDYSDFKKYQSLRFVEPNSTADKLNEAFLDKNRFKRDYEQLLTQDIPQHVKELYKKDFEKAEKRYFKLLDVKINNAKRKAKNKKVEEVFIDKDKLSYGTTVENEDEIKGVPYSDYMTDLDGFSNAERFDLVYNKKMMQYDELLKVMQREGIGVSSGALMSTLEIIGVGLLHNFSPMGTPESSNTIAILNKKKELEGYLKKFAPLHIRNVNVFDLSEGFIEGVETLVKKGANVIVNEATKSLIVVEPNYEVLQTDDTFIEEFIRLSPESAAAVQGEGKREIEQFYEIIEIGKEKKAFYRDKKRTWSSVYFWGELLTKLLFVFCLVLLYRLTKFVH